MAEGVHAWARGGLVIGGSGEVILGVRRDAWRSWLNGIIDGYGLCFSSRRWGCGRLITRAPAVDAEARPLNERRLASPTSFHGTGLWPSASAFMVTSVTKRCDTCDIEPSVQVPSATVDSRSRCGSCG